MQQRDAIAIAYIESILTSTAHSRTKTQVFIESKINETYILTTEYKKIFEYIGELEIETKNQKAIFIVFYCFSFSTMAESLLMLVIQFVMQLIIYTVFMLKTQNHVPSPTKISKHLLNNHESSVTYRNKKKSKISYRKCWVYLD